MKSMSWAGLLLMSGWLVAADYNTYFNFKTMRVDYFHFGKGGEEHFALDQIVDDGLWPGPKKNLLDSLQFGKYMAEVYDAVSGELIFSQGFATIFGEWETTAPAQTEWGVFHESVRFPMPKAPVRLVLKKRGEDQAFHPIWEQTIDPKGTNVIQAEYKEPLISEILMSNGKSESKVDVVFLGDGYRRKEKFFEDANRMMEALFEKEPFKSRRTDFNVRAVWSFSHEDGITRPQAKVFKRSPLSAQYGIFGSERYMLSYDNRTIRNYASTVPYEYLVILANEKTYGGGGIYRWQATSSVDNAFSDYVFVHEFGHHFAGLGDEYYTSSVAYETESLTEPWEANITANPERDSLKWADLVDADTKLPTKWNKKKFEKHSLAIQEKRRELRAAGADESELESLFEQQRAEETRMLSEEKHAGKVGAFEGAGYRAKGYYRPQVDCVMFTRNKVDFCAVCSRTIEQVIDHHIDQ